MSLFRRLFQNFFHTFFHVILFQCTIQLSALFQVRTTASKRCCLHYVVCCLRGFPDMQSHIVFLFISHVVSVSTAIASRGSGFCDEGDLAPFVPACNVWQQYCKLSCPSIHDGQVPRNSQENTGTNKLSSCV